MEEDTRPTHFIAIRIQNKKIRDTLEELFYQITELKHEYVKLLIPSKRAHLTLAVICLKPENKDKAIQVLQDVIRESKEKELKKLKLTLRGAGNFPGRKMAFVNLEPDEARENLENFIINLREKLAENGFQHIGKTELKPHLSFMSLSQATPKYLKEYKIDKIDPDLFRGYRSSVFGVETVQSVQILSMKINEKTGYYKIVHEESL